MTDIEQKALALVREVLAERNLSDKRAVRREVSPYTEALCRALEQHEDFKQEVSTNVRLYREEQPYIWQQSASGFFSRFIIPKPKPDPLVEVLIELDLTYGYAEEIRAALEARGLEIREKNDG
jgi:hypothetical protein